MVPALLFILAFFGYPLAYNVLISFRRYTFASFFPNGTAPWVGLDNYRRVVQDPTFHDAITHTAVFAVVSLLFQITVGLGFAVFFKQRFLLSTTLRSLIFPWLLPLIVSGAAIRWLLYDNGLVNYLLDQLHLVSIGTPISWLADTTWALPVVIVVNIWLGVPFNMVLLFGALQTIPDSLYEAGQIDGAGSWARFWHITLPLLRPTLAVAAVLGFIYTIKTFDVVYVLTGGGPDGATQLLSLFAFRQGFSGQFAYGLSAAVGNIGVLISVAVAFVYIVLLRHEEESGMSGLTAMPTADLPVRRLAPARRWSPQSMVLTALGVLLSGAVPVPHLLAGRRLGGEYRATAALSAVSAAAERVLRLLWPRLGRDQGTSLLTSTIIAAGALTLALALATPAAYAMAHLRLRITLPFVFILLVTQMFPTVMLGTPLYILYFHLHLLDSYAGLILANALNAVPFTILVLRAYIGTIPYEIVEAGKVDGLGEGDAFLRLIVPLASSGIVTAAIFNFLFAWGDFAFARTLTLKETIKPATLALYTFISANNIDYSGLLAASVLTALPATLVLLVAQRYISAGLTSGAVKL